MRILLPAVLLLAPVTGLAQQGTAFPAVARPEDQGFSSAKLARIDSLMTGLVRDGRIPGGVVLITRNGNAVMYKAWGYRNIETKDPLQKTDIFRIASQTKAITSTAILMLWEEGKFGLDDPISRYLPEFKDAKVLKTFNAADSTYTSEPAKSPPTIRQLLTHTSGVDYAGIGTPNFRAVYGKAGIPSGIGNSGSKICDKMRVLGGMPLRHEPGAEMTYALGLDVMGCLVEVTSGMPFDEFLRKRIFDPLGMKDTWFYLPQDRQSRLVTLHAGVNGKSVVRKDRIFDDVDPEYPKASGTYFSGGAGLSSTVEDYARFLQMYINKGELNGVRLLSPKTVEMANTDQWPKLGLNIGLAFGLETAANDHQSPRSLGSFSWGGAFATVYWADPKEGLTAQIYTNLYQNPVPELGGVSGRWCTQRWCDRPGRGARGAEVSPRALRSNARDLAGRVVFIGGPVGRQNTELTSEPPCAFAHSLCSPCSSPAATTTRR
jgi:CubicO group peptidase (beta-lactamase class C family)